MRILFKIFALICAVLFCWAIYVQHNDPDPLLWYAIYGVAALVSVAFIWDNLPFSVAMILAVLYVIGAIINWPEVFEGVEIGQGNIKNIEEGREALGLLFCASIFAIYAVRIRFANR